MNGTLEDLEVCFDTLGSEVTMVTIGSGLSVVPFVTIVKVVSDVGVGSTVVCLTVPKCKIETGL